MNTSKCRWPFAGATLFVLLALFATKPSSAAPAGDDVSASIPNDPVVIDLTKIQPALRERLRSQALPELAKPIHLTESSLSSTPAASNPELIGIERSSLHGSLLEAGENTPDSGFIVEPAPSSPLLGSSRGNHVMQVRDPGLSQTIVKDLVNEAENKCKAESSTKDAYRNCLLLSDVPQLKTVLGDLAGAGGACTSAAREYKNYLASNCKASCPDSPAVFNRFDDECLYSLLAWRRNDGKMRGDPQPAAFSQGGARDGKRGILDAVALIELVEQDRRTPICGALLLSNQRVLTARHCFNTQARREAWQAGLISVRLIRDHDSKGWPLVAQQLTNDDVLPADDALVVNINSTDPIPAPLVRFALPQEPGKALVLGYFDHFNRSRDLEGAAPVAGVSAISRWRQGLRWSKDGLCHVMGAKGNCVRIQCQTVKGYSGAPVFAEQQDPSQPLTVFGVISKPIDAQSQCGLSDTEATAVAAATHVTP